MTQTAYKLPLSDLYLLEPCEPRRSNAAAAAFQDAFRELGSGATMIHTPSLAYRGTEHVGAGAWLKVLHRVRESAELLGLADPFQGAPEFVCDRDVEIGSEGIAPTLERYAGGGLVYHDAALEPAERQTWIAWPAPCPAGWDRIEADEPKPSPALELARTQVAELEAQLERARALVAALEAAGGAQ